MSWSSLGLEPSTSCMTVQHSTTWANQARFQQLSVCFVWFKMPMTTRTFQLNVWCQSASKVVMQVYDSFILWPPTSSPVSALVLLLFSPWNFKVPQNSCLALLHINYTEWVIDSITSFFSLSSDFFFSCA